MPGVQYLRRHSLSSLGKYSIDICIILRLKASLNNVP